MRSPLLTYFRWWPRKYQAWQHTAWRSGYATISIGQPLDRTQYDSEPERNGEDLCAINDHSRSWGFVRSDIQTELRNPATTAKTESDTGDPSSRTYDTASLRASVERQRLRHGFQGLETVWRRLQKQKPVLRPNDPDALRVWNALLHGFMNRWDLLEDLIGYAGHVRKTSGADFRFLYYAIMSNTLRRNPDASLSLFALFDSHGLVPANRAGKCINDSINSQDPSAAFKSFRHLYETGSERNLYDASFHALQNFNASYRTMYKWHTLLLSHGDLPSTALLSHPMVKILLSRSQRLPFAKDLVLGTTSGNQSIAAQHLPRFTRDYMNTVVGDVHDIKQKSVSDALCARVFATGGLSTSFLVAGLAILGLDTIGPLALREIAARTKTTVDFLEALRIVSEREIAISPCIFSQALRKFAEDGRQDLFDGIVRSDRHPDIYEDCKLLERLADTYLKSEQPSEAHVILAVLSLTSDQTSQHQWNMLAQAECRSHRPLRVAIVLQDMIGQKAEVAHHTIACIRHDLLRQRAPGKRPKLTGRRQRSGDDDLTTTTNLLLSVARTGRKIDNSHWRELIKRYGMEGRMVGLRHLSLELASLHHLPSISAALEHTGSLRSIQTSRIGSPSRELFNAILQKAIIDWGFHSERSERWLPPALRSPDTGPSLEEKWLRGLSLLIELRDAGVSIDVRCVKEEVTKQLGKLYRPTLDFSAGVRKVTTIDDTELMRRYNLIEQAWGGKGLFKYTATQHGRASMENQTAQVLLCLFDHSGWISKGERRKPNNATKH